MGPELRLILVCVWAWAPLLTGAEPGLNLVFQTKLDHPLPPGLSVDGPQHEARVPDPVFQPEGWNQPPPGVKGGAGPSLQAVPSGGSLGNSIYDPGSMEAFRLLWELLLRSPHTERPPPGNIYHRFPSNNIGVQSWWTQGEPPDSAVPPGHRGWGYNWQRFSPGQNQGGHHDRGPSPGAFGGPGDQRGQHSGRPIASRLQNYQSGQNIQATTGQSSNYPQQTPPQNPNVPPGHRGWIYNQQNQGPSSSSSTGSGNAWSSRQNQPQGQPPRPREKPIDFSSTNQVWNQNVPLFKPPSQPHILSGQKWSSRNQGHANAETGGTRSSSSGGAQSPSNPKPDNVASSSRYKPQNYPKPLFVVSYQRGQSSGQTSPTPQSPVTGHQSNREYTIRYQAWVNREPSRQSGQDQTGFTSKRPLEPNVGSQNYKEEKPSQWLHVRPQNLGGQSQTDPGEMPPMNYAGSDMRYQLWNQESRPEIPPKTDTDKETPSVSRSQNVAPLNPKPLSSARFLSVRSQLLPQSVLLKTKPRGRPSTDGEPHRSMALWPMDF